MHCLWDLQAQGFQFELKGGACRASGQERKASDVPPPLSVLIQEFICTEK